MKWSLKIPPQLKLVATLPCEILMSVSDAKIYKEMKRLTHVKIFDDNFTANLLLNVTVNNFENQ